MKKKVKILSSIFAFCVAVTALCFGVYAALSINYTVSGTVNYSVSQSKVEITTQLYKSSYKATSSYNLKTNMVDALKTKTVAQITAAAETLKVTPVDINGDAEGTADVYNSTTAIDDSQNVVDNLEVKFKDNDALSYFIVISVKNIDESLNSYIRVINQKIAEDMNSFVYVSEGFAKIAPQETKTMVIAFALDDKTIAVKNTEFEYEIDVGAGEISSPIELVDANGDSTADFWGVKMGTQIKDDVITDVYWRLVSTDNGVSPYVFNKDVKPVGMSIFVMETAIVKNIAFHTTSNDYATSTARNYINGQMLTDLNIGTGNEILNNIKGRTLNDLYKGNIIQETATEMIYSNGTIPEIEGITPETIDKFYLLSLKESLNLLCDFRSTNLTEFNTNLSDIKNSLKWASTTWWLRTSSLDFGNYQSGILADGTIYGGTVTSEFAVRPAFNLYI